MILKDWLDRRSIDAKARECVELCGLPELPRETTNARKQERRMQAALDRLARDLVAYAREHRLGIYGKAKLCKCAEAHLHDSGVSQELASDFTARLAQRMAPFAPLGRSR